jgi:hypothetical protein
MLIMIVGAVGMTFFSRKDVKLAAADEKTLLNEEREDEDVVDRVQLGCCSLKRFWFGIYCAVFNGLYGGSVMVPLTIAKNNFHFKGGPEFVISFAIGAVIVNVVLWMGYCSVRRFYLKLSWFPETDFRVLALPGSIAGILWSIGNFCSIYAVLYLGQGLGYGMVQLNQLVAGLWGILWYREIKRWNILWWSLSALVACGGVVLVTLMHYYASV